MKRPYFHKLSVSKFDGDTGVSIPRLMQLLDASPYKESLIKLLDVASIKEGFIPIRGASTLVSNLEEVKKLFLKLDINEDISTVSITQPSDMVRRENIPFVFSFSSQKMEIQYEGKDYDTILAQLLDESITAEPIHNAQSKYFKELSKFDTYANSLLSKNQISIISTNIDLLQNLYSNQGKVKKFRLIRYNPTKEYYFRALVSENAYKDYNINVSAVIALVSIYKSMKTNSSNYIIKSLYLTHSELSVDFENTALKTVKNVGKIRIGITLSNNELAGEAVTITGFFSILVEVNGELVPLEVKKPDEEVSLSERILSIPHNTGPKRALSKMDFHKNLADAERRIVKEAEEISKIRNTEPLLKLFFERLQAKEETLQPSTVAELGRIYKQQTKTYHDLLKIMSKAQIILNSEGVETKEFLRYLSYMVLIKKSSNQQPPPPSS